MSPSVPTDGYLFSTYSFPYVLTMSMGITCHGVHVKVGGQLIGTYKLYITF